MELTHLKYFLEVAKNEHVTKSARNLCIVQPALTLRCFILTLNCPTFGGQFNRCGLLLFPE